MTLNTFSKVTPSIQSATTVIKVDDLISLLSTDDLNIAVTGDIHLAHRRVKTEKITSTLDREISNNLLEKLDVLVLNGDIFDKRIYMDSDPVLGIRNWVRSLIRRCAHYKVSLIVLKGTPSHDGDQCDIFPSIAETLSHGDVKPDVRYHNSLQLEKFIDNDKVNAMFPEGLMALYIPDELNHDSTVTWLQVNEKMRLAGIEKLDFAFIHGVFTYQEVIRTPVSHLEDNYVPITNHAIVINHWHIPSAKDNIIAPGSIERLTHGQEETKGFVALSLSKKKECKKYFVVNPTATLFKQLDCRGLTASEVLRKLEVLDAEPKPVFVEIRAVNDEEAHLSFNMFVKKFQGLTLTFKDMGGGVVDTLGDNLMVVDQIVAMRPDTIYSVLEGRMKHDDPLVLKRALEIISDGNVQT